MRRAFHSLNLFTPDGVVDGWLVVEGGTIAGIEPGARPPAGAELRELGETCLMPGLVDVHVHVNEPGRTEWEGFTTATRAAAAGGITTIVDMPLNSAPVTTTLAALAAKRRAAAGQCHVDVGFWAGLVPGNERELAALAAAGVLGFKAFLVPSGIDEFPAADREVLAAGMAAVAELGLPLLAHAELPGPIELATARLGQADRRSFRTFLASRPPAAEVAAVELLIELVRTTGCRLHVVHVAAAEVLPLLAAARTAGLPVSGETCPHYLFFSAEEVADGATLFKSAPPIRQAHHREALWRGLAEGTLQLVASDHSPCPPALKELASGDFFNAWGGIAGLQLLLPVTWTAAHERGLELAELPRWLAAAPAELAGLGHHKGRLAVGYDADLVIWDPQARFAVEGAALEHRHEGTPYEGRDLAGRVLETWLRGERIFDRGTFPTPARGRLLERGTAAAP